MDINDVIDVMRRGRTPAQANNSARAWYSIRNAAEPSGAAEVFIYDFIGYDPWFGGVSAEDFVRELQGITANKILLRINSPGGDIADAVAMRNALRAHPANVETRVEGLAASSASWVGLAADRVVMAPNATMMIHEPYTFAVGDSAEMEKAANMLNVFGDEIASMFAEKAGGTKNEWRDRMRAETWYTDQGAVDAGLADAIEGNAAQAENRFKIPVLNLYRNVPDRITQHNTPSNDVVQAALEYHRDQARRICALVGGS